MPPPDDKADAWPEDSPYSHRPPLKQEGSTSRTPLFTAIVVLLHTLLVGGCLIATMIIVPRFEKTFRDFNLRLSDATLFVLGVARWLNNYWYVLVPFFFVGLVLDGAIVYLLHRSRRTRRWSYVWAFGVVLLILLFSGCMGGFVYEPYSKLLDELGQ